LLESSVASVNSALQRARATLAAGDVPEARPVDPLDEHTSELLSRYVDAFERYDMEALVSLLHEDATQNMPPFEMWLQGRDDVIQWMLGPGAQCRGSRLLATTANGCPAFAQYRPSGPNGEHEPWALQVLEITDGRIAGISSFLDTDLFALLGFPERLDD
jgi:RNA polymerase sigma-70 factor (ECF subfamily)